MSRAVVRCPGSGRPEAFGKVVPVMPSCRARAVIMRGELLLAAAEIFATAAATSFADLVHSAWIADLDGDGVAGRKPHLASAARARHRPRRGSRRIA